MRKRVQCSWSFVQPWRFPIHAGTSFRCLFDMFTFLVADLQHVVILSKELHALEKLKRAAAPWSILQRDLETRFQNRSQSLVQVTLRNCNQNELHPEQPVFLCLDSSGTFCRNQFGLAALVTSTDYGLDL